MGVMKNFVIVSSILFVCFAYYLYTPLPNGIAEPWKVRGLVATFRAITFLGGLSESVGFMDSVNVTRTIGHSLMGMAETSKSDPLLEVSDMKFDGVPVRVYKPKSRKSSSPCLVYFHGGGWTFGSIAASDKLSSYIAKAANIIVVSVDYRLAPEHPFPIPFNDCVTATLHLIHNAARYGVSDRQVAVAGDSSGGNLAAAVSLKLSREYQPDEIRLCFQFLIYPALQAFDLMMPSYEDKYPVFLTKRLMTWFWANYIGLSPNRVAELMRNEHTSPTLKISKYARYVDQKRLPEKYHIKVTHERDLNFGNSTLSDEIQEVILDPYLAPLMASDLSKVASALIITAEYDVLRDEALLYIDRLTKAGVDVVNVHASDGFHGYMSNPVGFEIAQKSIEQFIEYAKNKFDTCL